MFQGILAEYLKVVRHHVISDIEKIKIHILLNLIYYTHFPPGQTFQAHLFLDVVLVFFPLLAPACLLQHRSVVIFIMYTRKYYFEFCIFHPHFSFKALSHTWTNYF